MAYHRMVNIVLLDFFFFKMIVSLEMTYIKYLVGRPAYSAVYLILATSVLPSRCCLIEVSTKIAAWGSSSQRFGLGPP